MKIKAFNTSSKRKKRNLISKNYVRLYKIKKDLNSILNIELLLRNREV